MIGEEVLKIGNIFRKEALKIANVFRWVRRRIKSIIRANFTKKKSELVISCGKTKIL
jgi:hypothetical protein